MEKLSLSLLVLLRCFVSIGRHAKNCFVSVFPPSPSRLKKGQEINSGVRNFSLFSIYTIYTSSNTKLTVTRYLYI